MCQSWKLHLQISFQIDGRKKSGLHKCYLAEGVSHNSNKLLVTQPYASFIFRITQIISKQKVFSDTKHSRIDGIAFYCLVRRTAELNSRTGTANVLEVWRGCKEIYQILRKQSIYCNANYKRVVNETSHNTKYDSWFVQSSPSSRCSTKTLLRW